MRGIRVSIFSHTLQSLSWELAQNLKVHCVVCGADLELSMEASDSLSWYCSAQPSISYPHVFSCNLCLSTCEELIQGIMDEHVLRLQDK